MAGQTLEDRIRSQVAASTVGELPAFPFESYQEFQQACAERKVDVWIRYDPAALWALSGIWERVFDLLLGGSALWISFGIVALALTRNDYSLWFGVPAAWLGWLLAAPNANLAQGCLPVLLAVTGVIASLATGKLFVLSGSASAAAYFMTSVALGVGDMTLREAMLKSEVILIWLYTRGTITRIQPAQEAAP